MRAEPNSKIRQDGIKYRNRESNRLGKDSAILFLSAKCLGAVDMNGRHHGLVRRRGFSRLGFLARHKPLKLASELFPLPRCGPRGLTCRILRGRRLELDRGYFVDDVRRTGCG